MRHCGVLCVVVGAERELALIGMLTWVVAVLTATHGILSALSLLQIDIETGQSLIVVGLADVDIIVDLFRITMVNGIGERNLVDG